VLECRGPRHPLTSTEKHVIDYLNENIEEISSLSITDISERAFVSTATVSRAIRKCGFSNFLAARYYLIQQINTNQDQIKMNSILAKSYSECIRTIENIHTDNIMEIAELIIHAPRIILIARGISRLIAEEFCFQLQCLHCNVSVMYDGEVMKHLDKYLNPNDLVIILSVFNSTPELYIAANHAKQNGSHVVTICCKTGTNLQELSDITVVGYSLPIDATISLGCSSRIPLMLITRTIVEYIGAINAGDIVPYTFAEDEL